METIHAIIWLIAGVTVLMLLVALYKRAEYRESVLFLRHTITVNLQILESELSKLSKLATEAEQSIDVLKARGLLSTASAIAQSASVEMLSNRKKDLGDLLSRIFDAMNQSTRARHLLGACVPYDGE